MGRKRKTNQKYITESDSAPMSSCPYTNTGGRRKKDHATSVAAASKAGRSSAKSKAGRTVDKNKSDKASTRSKKDAMVRKK